METLAGATTFSSFLHAGFAFAAAVMAKAGTLVYFHFCDLLIWFVLFYFMVVFLCLCLAHYITHNLFRTVSLNSDKYIPSDFQVSVT